MFSNYSEIEQLVTKDNQAFVLFRSKEEALKAVEDSRGKKGEENESRVMILKNLPRLINDNDIKKFLAGKTEGVASIRIERDPNTFLSTGTVKVEFNSHQNMKDALANANGTELRVRVSLLRFA